MRWVNIIPIAYKVQSVSKFQRINITVFSYAVNLFKTFLFTGLGWEPRFILIKGETAELRAVGYCVQHSMKLALKEGKLSVHNLPIGSVVREGKLLKLEIAITNALLKQMPSEHLTQGESGFILKALVDQGLDLKITATGTK